MSIGKDVQEILDETKALNQAIVANQVATTQAIADLATAVANIQTGDTDVSGLTASIGKLQASVDSISDQIADPSDTPAPAPAPVPAPAPAPEGNPDAAPETAPLAS